MTEIQDNQNKFKLNIKNKLSKLDNKLIIINNTIKKNKNN